MYDSLSPKRCKNLKQCDALSDGVRALIIRPKFRSVHHVQVRIPNILREHHMKGIRALLRELIRLFLERTPLGQSGRTVRAPAKRVPCFRLMRV